MTDIAFSPPAVREPSLRFMLSHPAHCISLGFGAGLAPFAPGTFGTLLGLFATRWLQPWLGDLWFFSALLGSLLLGTWAAGVTGRALGESDHGAIVWDEVVAMWIILWLCMPMGFWGQLVCFALFRFFDAAKPQPIKWADQLFKGFGPRGGWGSFRSSDV